MSAAGSSLTTRGRTGGFGIENDDANFHEIEMDVINEAKIRVVEGRALDLKWEMELLPGGPRVGVPATTRLTYAFDTDEPLSRDLNNLPTRK